MTDTFEHPATRRMALTDFAIQVLDTLRLAGFVTAIADYGDSTAIEAWVLGEKWHARITDGDGRHTIVPRKRQVVVYEPSDDEGKILLSGSLPVTDRQICSVLVDYYLDNREVTQ